MLIPKPAAKRPKMSERAQQQQELHFPGWPPLWLWNRRVHHGYTTVARTLPLAMQAIDDQSKGQPAGHTLFCLWARSPDHPLVIIENPATFAAEAGFTGERAVDTWRRRMKRLVELKFIAAKKGPAGDFSYVLLQNPNVAMEWMRQSGLVQDELYGRFLVRVTDVGGLGEVEAIRSLWTAERAALAAAAAAQSAAPANALPALTNTGLPTGTTS
ncbi:hypothetical protein ACG02S_01010 [Roseateles sp. DC23W]|uniref:DnaA N-terminal domain-containing protein n=1 Tax=Pelomonas dachongensis TaxID=3299029 RepID=A0ABW7EG86_9BURK